MKSFPFLLSLISPFLTYAGVLEIPKVVVYGERQPIIKPVQKEILPFEKEPISPVFARKKAKLPPLKIRPEKKNETDKGIHSRLEGGTLLGTYLLGYLRNFYYPTELSIEGLNNSTTEGSYLNLLGRASFGNFYINAGYLGRRSFHPIYSFSINSLFDILVANLSIAYSDSLLGFGDFTLDIIPFKFELQIENSFEYNLRAAFDRYPLRAGIYWYEKNIYPDLLYYLPFGYDLYLKGSLLNRLGLSHLFSKLPQYQWEYTSKDPYYRVELGKGGSLNLSLFYSEALLSDTLNYIGLSGSYNGFRLEAGYPLKRGGVYFRAGGGFEAFELLDINLFMVSQGFDNYFLTVDFDLPLMKKLRFGISGNFIKGWEEGFDLSTYLFFFF